jgi:hypothetical protein
MYASVASGGEADYLSRYNSSPPFWASAMRSFSLGTASRHTFAVSCVRRGGEQARFSNPCVHRISFCVRGSANQGTSIRRTARSPCNKRKGTMVSFSRSRRTFRFPRGAPPEQPHRYALRQYH